MDNHLFLTLADETQDVNVRKACARDLLDSTNGQYRSKAYWWLEKGYSVISIFDGEFERRRAMSNTTLTVGKTSAGKHTRSS